MPMCTLAAAAGRRGGRRGARRGAQGGVPADHAAVCGVHWAVAAAQLLDDALAHAARRPGAPSPPEPHARQHFAPSLATAHAQSLAALLVPSPRRAHAQHAALVWHSLRHTHAQSEALVVGRAATGGEAIALTLTTALTLAAACAAGVSVLGARRLQGDGAQGGRAPGAGAPAPHHAPMPCLLPAPPNLRQPPPCTATLRSVPAHKPCLHVCGCGQRAWLAPLESQGEERRLVGVEPALPCA
jgi:hypothetical protein